MAELKGTQTEQNLLTAFAGESQARNRYTYFAEQAMEEGFVQVANYFTETANQEKEHAKRFFKSLKGGDVEIKGSFPAGIVGTTAENLISASEGEHYEWSEMYPSFAKTARREGFESIAGIFEFVSVAEKHHERRYQGLLSNIVNGTVFERDQKVTWKCSNCGYLHEGEKAPAACPACAKKQAYFELYVENW